MRKLYPEETVQKFTDNKGCFGLPVWVSWTKVSCDMQISDYARQMVKFGLRMNFSWNFFEGDFSLVNEVLTYQLIISIFCDSFLVTQYCPDLPS